MKKIWILILGIASILQLHAQSETTSSPYVSFIVEGGDTIWCFQLPTTYVFAYRTFKNDDDRFNYMRYQRHAAIVYPYALEAVKSYRKLQAETQSMNNSDRKERIALLQDDMKSKFEKPLKQLSRTQGKILISMIEREVHQPMYDIIKELRGGFTAFYWNAFGSLYGYKLKRGYQEGEDQMLDIVLKDYDIPDNI